MGWENVSAGVIIGTWLAGKAFALYVALKLLKSNKGDSK